MKKFVVITLVSGMFLSGCNSQKISNLEQENKVLKDKIALLANENTQLKETADFHYKTGMDWLNAKQWERARAEFDTVVQKFPQSNLVIDAKKQYAVAVDSFGAEEKAKKIAEAAKQLQREKEYSLRGVDIDVDELLVNPTQYDGKRIRLHGIIGTIYSQGSSSYIWNRSKSANVEFDFDQMSSEDRRKLLSITTNRDALTIIGVWSSSSNRLNGERCE